MLKWVVRVVLLLGMIVAVPALSSIRSATVVFLSIRFGGPAGVATYAFGGSGKPVELPGVADATQPRRIAIGPDGKKPTQEERKAAESEPPAGVEPATC